jgi:hypothetical protein
MRGSFRKHPERKREREGEPEVTQGLGKAPSVLDEAERARWRDIAKTAPWLNVSHRPMVEQTCQLWMMQRRGTASPGHMKLFASNMRVLGMTPTDSSKVKMPPAAKPDAKRKRFFGT